MKQYLPIGSVVMLKGGNKRVMICGRVQTRVEDNTIFDYTACLYPEGYIDSQSMYLFNNEDIETIYYIGMQDVEEFRFRDIIEQELAKLKNTEIE